MDELVQKLSEGDHPVVLSRVESVAELRESVDRGYVLVEFTATRGGTELSVELDRDASDLATLGDGAEGGTVRLVGGLTLNDVDVRCVASIDVATLRGTGHLEVLGQ